MNPAKENGLNSFITFSSNNKRGGQAMVDMYSDDFTQPANPQLIT